MERQMQAMLGVRYQLNGVRLVGIFVGLLILVCLVMAPSASAQTYSVDITGGSGTGGGCASGTGTLTIGSGNSVEFTCTGSCYFGAVGFDAGAATQCLTHCSELSGIPGSLAANSTITFQGANVGACGGSAAADCSTSHSTEDFNLSISSNGFFTTSSSDDDKLTLGSTGQASGFGAMTLEFYDVVLVTPEPARFLLFGTGLLGLGVFLRKKFGLGRSA
jgi:hypothetical protein